MSISLEAGLRSQDAKRRQLAITKRRATALLGAVGAVFLATTIGSVHGGWIGYVQAAAEGSLVGGLADWFAVTALFRRPLGLPIPHTAIVVERKEQFGQTLAIFFRENFLSGATVAERVRTSAAVARASTWLADPEHATTFVRNVLQRSGSVLDENAERVVDAIVGEIRHVTTAVPLTEVSATIVRAAAESPQLDDGIAVACTAARRAILQHGDDLEVIFTG